MTQGYNLPAGWVIHTVGPVWQGGNHSEDYLLARCYQKSLELAQEHNLKTVAFPAISTGVYGYPKVAAATIAVSVMRTYEHEFDQIIICCFSDADADIYNGILEGGG